MARELEVFDQVVMMQLSFHLPPEDAILAAMTVIEARRRLLAAIPCVKPTEAAAESNPAEPALSVVP